MTHGKKVLKTPLLSVAMTVALAILLSTGAESFFCAAPLPANRININDKSSHTSSSRSMMAIATTPQPSKDTPPAPPTSSSSPCSARCIASICGVGMPKLLVDSGGDGGGGRGGGGFRGGGGGGDGGDHCDNDGDDCRLQPDLFAAAGLGGALEGLTEALKSFRMPWSQKVRTLLLGSCRRRCSTNVLQSYYYTTTTVVVC